MARGTAARPAPGLLKAAAVLGAVFHLGRAAAIANCAADVALEAIEHACHAGLVSAVADQVDLYTFRHALVREAVHEATAPGQRARMHLAAGELLEAEPRGRADAAELAMHFSHALMVGGAERAVYWGLEAGADATRQHAHEESVEHHRRALEALDLLPPTSAGERASCSAKAARSSGRASSRQARSGCARQPSWRAASGRLTFWPTRCWTQAPSTCRRVRSRQTSCRFSRRRATGSAPHRETGIVVACRA